MIEFFQILTETAGNPCGDMNAIVGIVRGILSLIQIGVPILLIIMGSIDLGKAVMSSDEKEIKGASSKLMKRAIAAIAVFLVGSMVVLIMNMVSDRSGGEANTADFIACWNNSAGGDKKCSGDPGDCTTGNNAGKKQECVGGSYTCDY